MGYWLGRGDKRYFVEGNRFFCGEGGIELDPVTLLPLNPPDVVKTSGDDVVPPSQSGEWPVPLEPTVEIPVEKEPPVGLVTKHLKSCKSQGRGGKLTDGCPRCEELKARRNK